MSVADYAYRLLLHSHKAEPDNTVKVDEQTSTFAYVGSAVVGALTSEAKWRIARIYRQGTIYTVEFAGNGLHDQIWDNRNTIFSAVGVSNSYATAFDGVNDYVDFGNNYTFEHSQAFSIGFWVKPNNIAATRCLISKCSNDANVYGYNLQHLITTGRIQIQMRSSGGTFPVHSFTSALTPGVWQHVVFTYSGNSNISGARCYVDTVVGDTPASSALSGTFANTASFIVGARNTAFPFSGHIDEVSVWNKALSQAEVNELYNSGQPGNLLNHSALANLQSWWRMGDNDTFPTILDQKGSINGTMTNMASDDFEADVP